MDHRIVSIVIPCYKQAHLISKAVQSCIDQTYPHTEIIVVNDGSPDDVKGALRPFGKHVKLIEQNNQGLSAARNTGLQMAVGEYVKFLDSDDWLLPHCIEQQFKVLEGLSKHIAVVGYRLHFDNIDREDEDVFPDFEKFSHALCYVNTGPPSTFLFPTETVRDLGGFDTTQLIEGGHEDYELVCRLAAKGFDAVVLHTIGCVYRQTSDSMSMQVEKMRKTRSGVWRDYAERLLEQDCAIDLLVHLIGGYGLRLRSNDFRYEAVSILYRIWKKISKMRKDIPQTGVVMLSIKLTDLLRYLPTPKTTYEQKQRDVCFRIIEGLTDIVLTKITFDPVLRANPLITLIDLASACMWSGHNRWGRKLLIKAILTSPHGFSMKARLQFFRFFSIILPGKLVVFIWRCTQNFYQTFFQRR